jgi:hypothetical protein
MNSPERKLGVYESKRIPTLKGLNYNSYYQNERLLDIPVDMMLNPFWVLNVGCIVHPGLSTGAIEVEPLSGY